MSPALQQCVLKTDSNRLIDLDGDQVFLKNFLAPNVCAPKRKRLLLRKGSQGNVAGLELLLSRATP
jgi:hypothetical protein